MHDLRAETDRWKALAAEEVRVASEEVARLRRELDTARSRLVKCVGTARNTGLTLHAIGEAMGVSRQRVHGMLQ
jgi:DNA-directed RNA polymerase sigma subunit (sigma70/sigma32)